MTPNNNESLETKEKFECLTLEQARLEIEKFIKEVIRPEGKVDIEKEPINEFYDDKGLTVLTFRATEEGMDEYMEIEYVRAGNHNDNNGKYYAQATRSGVGVTFYSEQEMPISGKNRDIE